MNLQIPSINSYIKYFLCIMICRSIYWYLKHYKYCLICKSYQKIVLFSVSLNVIIRAIKALNWDKSTKVLRSIYEVFVFKYIHGTSICILYLIFLEYLYLFFKVFDHKPGVLPMLGNMMEFDDEICSSSDRYNDSPY